MMHPMRRQRAAISILLACALLPAQQPPSKNTLDRVRLTGSMTCGIVRQDPEYTTEDDHATRGGFDDDLCKAVGVAASASVKLISFLDEASAVGALRAGRVDLIPTLSAAHKDSVDVSLTTPIFYDAIGVLVPAASGWTHMKQLASQKICVIAETGTEEVLQHWFAARHLDLLPFPFQEQGEMEAAYATGNCAAIAGSWTRLSLVRLYLHDSGLRERILTEVLGQQPMAMATRTNDQAWFHLVARTRSLLIRAEQVDRTSKDSDAALESQARLTLTQQDAATVQQRSDWAKAVLSATGNYGQIFERNLGNQSERNLARGLNRPSPAGALIAGSPLP
jgi:general L-amino acid transport system substrate-binding protein